MYPALLNGSGIMARRDRWARRQGIRGAARRDDSPYLYSLRPQRPSVRCLSPVFIFAFFASFRGQPVGKIPNPTGPVACGYTDRIFASVRFFRGQLPGSVAQPCA